MSFNTAIARLMEFVNHFTSETVRPKQAMETLVLLLAPMAPHLAEELWALLGHKQSLAYEPWPTFDPDLIKASEVEILCKSTASCEPKSQFRSIARNRNSRPSLAIMSE